ncbi:MAG: branched-chain amino acid ABC transporter permease [Desulfobacteraceae bacterium]|nr:MAG: branched-chain amino acid ABC transporter permease [Desulfobacteraceae bacterium]
MCRFHLGELKGRFFPAGDGGFSGTEHLPLALSEKDPMKPATRFPVPFLVFALAVFLLPLVVSGSYVIGVMCFVALYGALALGKGVLLEQAGIFSLAHPTWFGLGAYVTGIAAVKGLPPLTAILLAAGFVALVAFVLGAPLLRLKGYYLACATFSLMLIIEIVIANLGSLTGGHDGLMGIPPLSIGGLALEGDRSFYFLSWGLCLGNLLVSEQPDAFPHGPGHRRL